MLNYDSTLPTLVCGLLLWSTLTHLQQTFDSTYPHMSRYLEDIIDPAGNCPNFVCNLSALSSSQIDTFINHENRMRAEYAKANNITNLYRVYWDDDLAKIARRKVQMCLPPTFENEQEKYLIFDNEAANDFPESSPIRQTIAATMVQVLIAERSENYVTSSVNLISFQTKFIDDYSALFYSKIENFEIRSATTLVGCGYLFQQTGTTYTGRLVCVYGMLYLEMPNIIEVGEPCTNCTYFTQYFADSRPPAPDRVEMWGCDRMYPTLCADLNKKALLQYKPSEFNCADPKEGLAPEPRNELEKITELPANNPSEIVAVPCWYVAVPLGLIILAIVVACVFHSVTALMTYLETTKKSTTN